MTYNIVIPVFNRLASLKRLLWSVENSVVNLKVNLYISCEGNISQDVLQFVENFKWKFGVYTIIQHKSQLGVDKHNVECIRLCSKLDGGIVIEDDILVSPYFLEYLKKICSNLNNLEDLAAVGLYRYPSNEFNFLPFNLIPNNEFVYYQKRPCSKGTYYTKMQAKSAVDYFENFKNNFTEFVLPENVKKWNDEIWEKVFYCFLQEKNKYVAFPRYSLTTDMGEYGVHMKGLGDHYRHQSHLYLSADFPEFRDLERTVNVYDSFYELKPEKLLQFNADLEKYEFEMNISGGKSMEQIKAPFMISNKACHHSKASWARVLKPEINNIILGQKGNYFHLGKTSDFVYSAINKSLYEDLFYYYTDVKLTRLLKLKLLEIKKRYVS